MKKLLIAAVAAGVAGASQAALTYQYKASVKHMYAKVVKVRDTGNTQRQVYQKIIKSASLKGWLVVDDEGATSATLIGDRGDANTVRPGVLVDHGRNRAFLVVQNPSATLPFGSSVDARTFRTAKILPAVIEANFINDYKKVNGAGAPDGTSGIAEGYLYVGGETVGAVRPKLDFLTSVQSVQSRGAAMPTPGAGTTGMTMVQDYVWTSCYLFGGFNGPDYEGRAINPGWWQAAQLAIDTGFEGTGGGSDAAGRDGVCLNALTTTAGWTTPWNGAYYFHDTWMNGSGFGKFTRTSGGCCGFTSSASVLESLSGSLKGGLFLCTYEGLVHGANTIANAWLNNYNVWEDQWFTPAWGGTGTSSAGAQDFAGDQTQIDLWQDGPLELNTTDIITGTWSIKLRANNAPSSDVTVAEMRALSGNAAAAGNEASTGLKTLVDTLKGCALNLNNSTTFVINNGGSAAGEVVSRVANGSTRYNIPALTPWFAQYYGLGNFN